MILFGMKIYTVEQMIKTKLNKLIIFFAVVIGLAFPNVCKGFTFQESDLSPEDYIQGDIQTPEIPSFIQRANVNKNYNLNLDKSFLPNIIQSVEQQPF
jgi:hypothetical protein